MRGFKVSEGAVKAVQVEVKRFNLPVEQATPAWQSPLQLAGNPWFCVSLKTAVTTLRSAVHTSVQLLTWTCRGCRVPPGLITELWFFSA